MNMKHYSITLAGNTALLIVTRECVGESVLVKEKRDLREQKQVNFKQPERKI